MAKTSFIMHLHFEPMLQALTEQEIGRLMLAVFEYQKTGVIPEFTDRALTMAFAMIKQQFDIDDEKYQTVCEKRREAIEKRWGKKTEQENSTNEQNTKEYKCIKKNTNEYKSIQPDTKDTDNDNVNENDNVNDNENSIINNTDIHNTVKEKIKRKDKATVEEIRAYCQERGNNIDPQYFYDRMEACGWKLKNGQIVKDWKACIRTWESFTKKRATENSGIQWGKEERNDDVTTLF